MIRGDIHQVASKPLANLEAAACIASPDGPAAAGIIEPDLRVGTADGDGPELFGQVRDIEADAVDREDYVWVVPQIPDNMATALDVFDAEGRYLGRRVVSAPIQGASPGPVIRGEHLYAETRDELGVQYVLRAPLAKTEAPETLEPGE